MPLHSNVLVSAYALGRVPESGVMPTPPDGSVVQAVAPPALDTLEDLSAEIEPDDDEERPSRPIARIAIMRMSALGAPATTQATQARGVELALTGARMAHVTIALADGTVLHEGSTGDDGLMAVRVEVPIGQTEVRAMIEIGSKHRTALVRIADEGRTEFSFR